MSILSQQKQSVSADFPNVRPSLDLRFALAKKLDPRITFTRGSSGTYFGPDGLMRTAGVNEPRFDHDPVTGQSLGLFVEESRSNLVAYSDDFSGASWGGLDRSISTNVITSPDGTTNADAFIENTLSNKFHYLNQTLSKSASSTVYTASCWLKDKGRQVLMNIQSNGSNGVVCRFNPATGQMTVSPTAFGTGWIAGSFSVVPYPNGWYRVSMTATSDTLTTVVFQLATYNTSVASNVYTGDGTSGIYIWGAQLEQGAFPTSYIPTSGSTVTRSADNASMTGTNFSSWYNQSEGTFFTDVKSFAGFVSSSNACPFGIFGTANQIVLSNYHTLSSIWFFRNSFASNNAFFNVNMSTEQNRKSIATYKTGTADYYTAAFGGSNLRNSTTSAVSTNPRTGTLRTDQISFELNPNKSGLVPLNGHISRLTYYPIQLTQTQLINLTS